MRWMLMAAAVVVAGCAAPATVEQLGANEPVMTAELSGDRAAATKCIVSALDQLGWQSSVRNFGTETQIVWYVQTGAFVTQPLAVFAVQPASAGRSRVEMRIKSAREPDRVRKTWEEKLSRCG